MMPGAALGDAGAGAVPVHSPVTAGMQASQPELVGWRWPVTAARWVTVETADVQ